MTTAFHSNATGDQPVLSRMSAGEATDGVPPPGVVVVDLARQDRARLTNGREQRLVEQFVARAAIEAGVGSG